jgi:hypothetical protein
MTAGTLVLVVAAGWAVLLVSLLRLVARMERTERELKAPDARGRPAQGSGRG